MLSRVNHPNPRSLGVVAKTCLFCFTLQPVLTACENDLVEGNGSGSSSLQVVLTTGGVGLDPDGYTATVDGTSSEHVDVNATTTFSDVSPGEHTVQLSGVAFNCAIDGSNPRSVSVPANSTATNLSGG